MKIVMIISEMRQKILVKKEISSKLTAKIKEQSPRIGHWSSVIIADIKQVFAKNICCTVVKLLKDIQYFLSW